MKLSLPSRPVKEKGKRWGMASV